MIIFKYILSIGRIALTWIKSRVKTHRTCKGVLNKGLRYQTAITKQLQKAGMQIKTKSVYRK